MTREEAAYNYLKAKLRALNKEVCSLKDGTGGVNTENDPVFRGSPAFGITSSNITKWNSALTSVDWSIITNRPTVPTNTNQLTNGSGYITSAALSDYQPLLVSGSNIRTINGQSLLGNTDLIITASSAAGVDLTSDQTAAGLKTWSRTATFTDTWANGQISIGGIGQAAKMTFVNGNNGVAGLTLGYAGAAAPLAELVASVSGGLNIRATNTNGQVTISASGTAGVVSIATGGSETMKLFNTGNVVIQNGGTFIDAGFRLDVNGTQRVSGVATFVSNIVPSADNTVTLGTAALRFSNIYSNTAWSGNYVSTGTVGFGTTNIASAINFRQGNGSQIVAGFYGTSGNMYLQAPAAASTTDTGERLQVAGNVLITGNLATTGNESIGANLSVTGTSLFTGNVTNAGTLILRAGTATAGTAPIKFTSGPLLTTAETGSLEFLNDKYYATITTGASRKEFALVDTAAGLTSGRITYATTNGRLTDIASFLFATTRGGLLSVGTTAATSNLNVGATATATGNFPLATFTAAAHTAQTASTELLDINFNLSRIVTFATGAKAVQRAFLIQAPTYAAVAASVITDSATLAINGAPIAGANTTITNGYALWIQGGLSKFGGSVNIDGQLISAGNVTTGSDFISTKVGGSVTLKDTTNGNTYKITIKNGLIDVVQV